MNTGIPSFYDFLWLQMSSCDSFCVFFTSPDFVVVSIPRLGRGLTPQYASPEMIATNSMNLTGAKRGNPFFRDAGGCYKSSMKVKPNSEV